MHAYRMSLLRSDGWIRAGIVGAGLMVPVTAILWSLGLFNDGDKATLHAVAFFIATAWMFLFTGFCLGWVLHGFAVRTHAEGEDEQEGPARPHPLAGSRPGGPAHPGASATVQLGPHKR